jgi:citrate lyase beta subunit
VNRRVRLRRSLLITPASQPQRVAKACGLAADGVVLDLEDGVGEAEKAAARRALCERLANQDFGWRERIVRVNAAKTAHFAADMACLDLSLVDTIFLPKAESAQDVRVLADWLDHAEARRGLGRQVEVIATIETPRGLLNALAIAEASPRTTALFFGSGDYSAATGAKVAERALAVPRALIVAAAASVGIAAIDAAYFTAVKDAEATRADALAARDLGFAGKLVFHPNQIAPVNEVFSPDAAEVARARRIVAAYAEAKAAGRGTAFVDGEFIALDIALMAERVLNIAQAIDRRTAR